MTPAHLTAIADRKALLVTRAELDRTRMTLALHEIRAIVHPAPDPSRSAAFRPTAAMIVGFAAPILGMNRFARWVRFASLGLAAYRIASSWRNR
jgi:hypothetical protein